MPDKTWDIFISHAAEDKAVARPLVSGLREAGVRVWLDEHELTIGDSLSEKIDEGLSRSRFGAVILSPAFFAKHWPTRELAGLRAREEQGTKVILPIWHNMDKMTVARFSPILADALAATTQSGISAVVDSIVQVIFSPTSDAPSARKPSVARRLIEILDSEPQKKTVVEFLAFHLQRTGRYLGWGGELTFDAIELGGIEFDAYAAYVGHGWRLGLVRFTQAWSTPFATDRSAETAPQLRLDLSDSLSQIQSLIERYKVTPELQEHAAQYVVAAGAQVFKEFPGYFRPSVAEWGAPKLNVFVFAGRRNTIDATATTNSAWSPIVRTSALSGIEIRSYDNLIDAFVDASAE
jgi:hypothetical protein